MPRATIRCQRHQGATRGEAKRVRAQVKDEANISRIGALHHLADQLEAVSPYRLRYELALAYQLKRSQVPLEDIGWIFGHTKPQITIVIYGSAFENDHVNRSMRRARSGIRKHRAS